MFLLVWVGFRGLQGETGAYKGCGLGAVWGVLDFLSESAIKHFQIFVSKQVPLPIWPYGGYMGHSQASKGFPYGFFLAKVYTIQIHGPTC